MRRLRCDCRSSLSLILSRCNKQAIPMESTAAPMGSWGIGHIDVVEELERVLAAALIQVKLPVLALGPVTALLVTDRNDADGESVPAANAKVAGVSNGRATVIGNGRARARHGAS